MKPKGWMLALALVLTAAWGMPTFGQTSVAEAPPDHSAAALEAALTPAAMAARIERYRQGPLTVIVQDAQGHAVANAAVHVAQTRHSFLFGCNIFLLKPDDTAPIQKAYQEQFVALFNYATLPFYWGSFEAQQGKPQYGRLEAMARWCVAHGVTPKGHPLIWHNVWPAWAPHDPDAAIPLLQQRVTDLIPRYKDTIHYWDVLNEAHSPDATAPHGWSARPWIGPAPPGGACPKPSCTTTTGSVPRTWRC